MYPILPSLLCRPLYSTLGRAPRQASSAITRTYFTPNGLRKGTHRRFVNCAHAPPPYPFHAPAATRNCDQTRLMDAMRPLQRRWRHPLMFWLKFGAAGVGLALTFLAAPVIYCEPDTLKSPSASATPQSRNRAAAPPSALPLPPQSSVNLYELTFGSVCGVCAGVFVKKGAKLVAFTLGGVFVLLQYLGSFSILRVDWNRAASRFENLFYTKDASGVARPPNVSSLFRWIVDFLTADFQPRATFIAGFVLGLRIG